jgi:hypothetical protein
MKRPASCRPFCLRKPDFAHPAAAECRHFAANNVETVDHLHAALEIAYRSSYVPASPHLASDLG